MGGFILLFLIVIVMVFVVPAVALAKASRAMRAIEELKQRLLMLEARLHREGVSAQPPETVTEPKPAAPIIPPVSVPPPLPVTVIPPPIPETKPIMPIEEVRLESKAPPARTIDWEQFMGAKMFAWIGGFALFLGVAFFVKYSFEHNLIPPELRVAIGFLAGIALVGGGVALTRKENVVTAQTLCATGILILYAVTFACRSFYHFPFFGLVPTFALMSLITAAAFLLAVQLDALVVAILGIGGGFLTPVLLSTGQDNPLGLFGYIALLDIGLLAVARRKEWSWLTLLAAIGTMLMQFAWLGRFYAPEKINIAMTIFLGFAGLFVAAVGVADRTQRSSPFLSAAALIMPSSALAFAFHLLSHPHPEITGKLWFYFGYVFAADAAFLIVAWLRPELRLGQIFAGSAVFLLLATWTAKYLSAVTLNSVLALYFIFALLHTVFPIAMQRARPGSGAIGWAHIYPSLALLLILLPLG